MSYAKPIAPLILAPISLDKAIQAVQLVFVDALPWLDYSFGRALRASRMDDASKRAIYYPEIYVGDGRYQSVEPNSHYGSHSFIQLAGPEKPIQYEKYLDNIYTVELEAIFLFNLEKIKAKLSYNYQHRFIEELKRDVRNALKNTPQVDRITAIYETPEDVFRGYSYNNLTQQTFKHPNGGFKVGFAVSYPDRC